MEEMTFFEQNGVSVTNARFISQGQTYAMSGITSVKTFVQTPSRKGPIIVGLIGLLGLAGGKAGLIVALIFIAASIAWWVKQKSEYSVLLSSASGEAKALTSADGEFISKVVGALNSAIVHRG